MALQWVEEQASPSTVFSELQRKGDLLFNKLNARKQASSLSSSVLQRERLHESNSVSNQDTSAGTSRLAESRLTYLP